MQEEAQRRNEVDNGANRQKCVMKTNKQSVYKRVVRVTLS